MSGQNKEKWHAFVSGDEESYGWIYRRFVQSLYSYGLRFTQDRELVKDCIQELFVHLYQRRGQLSAPENLKVYLFVALKNRLLRALSYESRSEPLETARAAPFSLEPTVEDAFIEQEAFRQQEEQVKTILSVLTSRQQEIIYYRYIQELPLEEICLLMDLNYQSAQNLIQRALKKLKTLFN